MNSGIMFEQTCKQLNKKRLRFHSWLHLHFYDTFKISLDFFLPFSHVTVSGSLTALKSWCFLITGDGGICTILGVFWAIDPREIDLEPKLIPGLTPELTPELTPWVDPVDPLPFTCWALRWALINLSVLSLNFLTLSWYFVALSIAARAELARAKTGLVHAPIRARVTGMLKDGGAEAFLLEWSIVICRDFSRKIFHKWFFLAIYKLYKKLWNCGFTEKNACLCCSGCVTLWWWLLGCWMQWQLVEQLFGHQRALRAGQQC